MRACGIGWDFIFCHIAGAHRKRSQKGPDARASPTQEEDEEEEEGEEEEDKPRGGGGLPLDLVSEGIPVLPLAPGSTAPQLCLCMLCWELTMYVGSQIMHARRCH